MDLLIPSAIAFLLSHFFPATPLRKPFIAAVGQNAYLGIYSLVSLAVLIWLVIEYRAVPYGERLWTFGDWWYWIKPFIILSALILLTVGLATPNPMVPRDGGFVNQPKPVHNVLAITRHPQMWAFALWAGAHSVSQPTWRGLWFFGTFTVMALLGAWFQERRKAAEYGDAWRNFRRYTSFFPFAAMLSGRTRLHIAELGWKPVGVAVLIWLAILWFHARLFDAVPIPQLGMWLS